MQKLQKLEQLIRDLYEKQDPNRDEWADWLYENHVFVVGDYARVLAKRFGADYDMSVGSAWLHDIADVNTQRSDDAHEQNSLKIAKDLLKEAGYIDKEVDVIIDDILPNHGCRDGLHPKSPEGQVMAMADALGHLKTDFYDFAKEKFLERGQTIDDFNNWLRPKIKRDYEDKICFDEVRQEVTAEYEKFRNMLERAGISSVQEYIKDYYGWNSKKKTINDGEYDRDLFFGQREVWWSSVGVNIGVETDGKHKNFERPILIVKVFNGHMLWGIPLTSKKKVGEHYIKIKHDKGVSWANVPQMRVISTKRLLRKIGMVSEKDFNEVTNKISAYTKIDPRKSGGLGGRSH